MTDETVTAPPRIICELARARTQGGILTSGEIAGDVLSRCTRHYHSLLWYRWFKVKKKAYRKQLANALKLWQKNGYIVEAREIVRARAANQVRQTYNTHRATVGVLKTKHPAADMPGVPPLFGRPIASRWSGVAHALLPSCLF